MTNKKHQQPKVKPPKRLYYRLSEAARELTKYFGEEITEDDLVHWGAMERTNLLVSITKDGGVNWDCLVNANFHDEKEFNHIEFNIKDLVFALMCEDDSALAWFVENAPHFGLLPSFSCQVIEAQKAIKNGFIDLFNCYYTATYPNRFMDMIKELSSCAPFNDKRVSLVFSGVNITKADLFISAEEVERIKRGEEPEHLPEEEQNSMAKLMRQPRPQRMRKEHALIAALLADRKNISAKDLEKAAQSVGAEISDDTIRSIIREVQRVAPGLPNFET